MIAFYPLSCMALSAGQLPRETHKIDALNQ